MPIRRSRLSTAVLASTALALAGLGAAVAPAAAAGGGGPGGGHPGACADHADHSDHSDHPDHEVVANPDPGPYARFGQSVALAGDRLAVGSPSDRFQVSRPGAAYLFDADGHRLQRRLASPASAPADEFGWAVALHGKLVAVGAPQQGGAGAVHLYRASSGKLLRSVTDPAGAFDDRFGESVALSGNRLLVGASGVDSGGDPFAGAAYLFDTTTGALVRTFANPEPGNRDAFGASVAIDGDRVLIGAGGFGGTGTEPARDGAAYLFDLRSGALLQTFHNPTAPAGDENFGLAVALDGRRALIGARGNRNGGQDLSGAAFAFDTRTGDLTATILNPAPDAVDFFGDSVSLQGRTALIGAPLDRTASPAGGAAYLVDIERGRVLRSWFGPAGNGVGTSTALSGDRAVVGAPSASTGSGEVWLGCGHPMLRTG